MDWMLGYGPYVFLTQKLVNGYFGGLMEKSPQLDAEQTPSGFVLVVFKVSSPSPELARRRLSASEGFTCFARARQSRAVGVK